MTKNFKINSVAKTISTTKAFAKRANVFGTAEYNIMKKLQSDFPTYSINNEKIKVKVTKETHKGLKFKHMEFYIKALSDNPQSDLAEFESVKKEFQGEKCKYGKVKQWFLERFDNYKDYYKLETVEVLLQKQNENEEEATTSRQDTTGLEENAA